MTQPSPVPLTTVLSLAATEALRLSQIAGQIDRTLGSLKLGAAPLPAATLKSLQSADLLRQSLECLACYLDALSQSAEPGTELPVAPALEALPLRGLAEALQGTPARGRTGVQPTPEPDFF